jgi:hypothetical protein
MSFGKKGMQARMFSFDCSTPTNLDIIEDQMFKKHKYRNALVPVECERRIKTEAARVQFCAAYQTIDEQSKLLRTQIDLARQVLRMQNQTSRKKVSKKKVADNQAIKDMVAQLKIINKEKTAVRKETWKNAEFIAACDVINKEAVTAVNALRLIARTDGLWWGNQRGAEKCINKNPKFDPPSFHKWRFVGSVGTQIQHGMPLPQAYIGTHMHFRLRKITAAEIESKRQRVDKKGRLKPGHANGPGLSQRNRYIAMIRINSTDTGKPIWTELSFIMNEDHVLPDDCSVREIYLQRFRIGPHLHWRVHFAVAKPEWEPKAIGTGIIGVDVGWRTMPEGLRVAYWYHKNADGSSDEGQVLLPNAWLADWDRYDKIKSDRTNNFNAIKVQLCEWRDVFADLPAWFAEQTVGMSKWDKKGNMNRLLRHWTDNRFDGDDAMFCTIAAWATHDRRQLDIGESIRTKAIARRNMYYRKVVRDLGRKYGYAAIEKLDLRRFKRKPEVETNEARYAIRASDIAAVSKFRAYLREAFPYTEFDPYMTTKMCHVCHKICVFDAAKVLEHTCEHCTAHWDQDRNSAINLYDMQVVFDGTSNTQSETTEGPLA